MRLCAFTVPLAFAALLCGCDKVTSIQSEQLDQKNRIANLEAEVAALKRVAQTETPKPGLVSFNACVLENMKGVTANLGAVSVKESCIRTVEKVIPSDVMQVVSAATAAFGPIHANERGLHVNMNDATAYTLTELRIVVGNVQTKQQKVYLVRVFPAPVPAGFVITGAPPDKTVEMMLPPGEHTFTVPIAENADDPSTFFQTYTWGISSAKGFLN